MKDPTLTEIIRADAAREFPRERREALWQELQAAMPAPSPCARSRAPRAARIVRFLAIGMAALLLCFGIFYFAGQQQDPVVAVAEPNPPLSTWADASIVLATDRVTFPVGSQISQNGLLAACGAKAMLEGSFVVSGLDGLDTTAAKEIVVQITLQDAKQIALGSVFVTVVIES